MVLDLLGLPGRKVFKAFQDQSAPQVLLALSQVLRVLKVR